MLTYLGALSLIISGYLVAHTLTQFAVKCVYRVMFKAAVDEVPARLSDLFAEVDAQNAWIGLLWKQPLATLFTAAVIAAGFRFGLGLSLSIGLGTVVFLVMGVLAPLTFRALRSSQSDSAAPLTRMEPGMRPEPQSGPSQAELFT